MAISGFSMGSALIKSGAAIMRRDRAALRATGRLGVAHHAAVLIAIAPAGLDAVAAASIPCGVGALLSLALIGDGRRGSA
jgi:hypothetical protein